MIKVSEMQHAEEISLKYANEVCILHVRDRMKRC